jgi:hypothetical protein
MSFGEPPSGPYGPSSQPPQPPQPPQNPAYGYPGQQGLQPGPSYPSAPPVQPYYGAPYGGYPGGGYPGQEMQMPGGVKAARVMLWVISGLSLLGAIFYLIIGVAANGLKHNASVSQDANVQTMLDRGTSILIVLGVVGIVWCILSAVLAVKTKSGGNGVRVTTIVVGIVTAVLGIYPFLIVGLPHLVLSILVVVFVAKSDGAAWYRRPAA